MVSIVIPNWNGKDFLEKCVPSVMKAVGLYGDDAEVIVIDNGSSDGSINYLNDNFPEIRGIALKENLDFAKAMNMGIKESRYPVVIGLNNDVIVDEGFIEPLINHFSNDGDIFAVATKVLLWDKRTLNFGKAIGSFSFGLFRWHLIDSPYTMNTLYACGGGFAVDRDKFLKLGGFDEDMVAFWEDVDICYRAWKRGWRTIYEPRSIVYHKWHGSYNKRYSKSAVRRISGENQFLFVLKNIHDRVLFYQWIFLLPFLMLASILVGRSHFTTGLLRSLRKWPLFLKKRRIEKEKTVYTDREILKISSRD